MTVIIGVFLRNNEKSGFSDNKEFIVIHRFSLSFYCPNCRTLLAVSLRLLCCNSSCCVVSDVRREK